MKCASSLGHTNTVYIRQFRFQFRFSNFYLEMSSLTQTMTLYGLSGCSYKAGDSLDTIKVRLRLINRQLRRVFYLCNHGGEVDMLTC